MPSGGRVAGGKFNVYSSIENGHSYSGFNEEIIWISIAMSILIGILILVALCFLFREKCKKRREINADRTNIKYEVERAIMFQKWKKLFLLVIFFANELGSLNANNYNDSITESTLYNFTELSTTVEIRRNRFWREWRRGDPSVNKSMWNSKAPLGKAELYIVVALLIGFCTVVIGCWLSDNCWSPEPEHVVMIA